MLRTQGQDQTRISRTTSPQTITVQSRAGNIADKIIFP